MTKPPMVKLCDFGFAKTWESNEEANMYTHIGYGFAPASGVFTPFLCVWTET